ncbi:hypothetical protein GGR57DRAFT_515919 [Xylariaceae sp. FL1272]|nr:hypothetical protein GGR57DRAFT_515919 [Xylariaceae sp. FL1272]
MSLLPVSSNLTDNKAIPNSSSATSRDKMPLSILKKTQHPKRMTKADLTKLAQKLSSLPTCVDSQEALREKSGYDSGKQFPDQLYKNGVQKTLLEQWLSEEPQVNVLDGRTRNFDSSYAGREWAAYLRVRNPDATVLRVYPKDRTASPEGVLGQILISLVVNLVKLAPSEFQLKLAPSKEDFGNLARGGSDGVAAGIAILDMLPPLELRNDMLLCIVDGLRLAQIGQNLEQVETFKLVLERVMKRNHCHLLYT